MTATEAAWLAGFFDGEGSITKYKGGRYKSECWKLTLPNTHLGALKSVQEITGVGALCLKRSSDPTHKEQWQWQMDSKLNMESIIRQMLPYLRIKREKAEELLEFVDRTRPTSG